jgi:hypothetical protein
MTHRLGGQECCRQIDMTCCWHSVVEHADPCPLAFGGQNVLALWWQAVLVQEEENFAGMVQLMMAQLFREAALLALGHNAG